MDIHKPVELEEQTQEDFKIEISDLEQVDYARNDLFSWFTRTLLAWQRPENRRHWRLASVLSVCLLSLLVVLLSLGSGLSALIANSLHLNLASQAGVASNGYSLSNSVSSIQLVPKQDGIACLVDASWSPDSQFIAILGYTQNCPQRDYVPAQVNIYDAHSGKLLTHWQPDDPIGRMLYSVAFFPARLRWLVDRKPLLGTNGGLVSVAPIYYSHLLWSPDGQRLALTFTAATRVSTFDGMLLIDPRGKQPEVFMQRQNTSRTPSIEWDLGREGTVKHNAVPVAITYHWALGGLLVPESLLTNHTVSAATQRNPVGNPDGGNFFSIWQPGAAMIVSQSHTPSVYTWNAHLTAWSPDESYLIDGIDVKVLLEPVGHPFPNAQTLSNLGLDHLPLLSVPDTALFRAAFGSITIAWRPDGRVLAASNFAGSVDIYDSLSGRKLATLVTPVNRPPISGPTALLRWSPDGSHLLLASARWGILTLWGPGQLPQ